MLRLGQSLLMSQFLYFLAKCFPNVNYLHGQHILVLFLLLNELTDLDRFQILFFLLLFF